MSVDMYLSPSKNQAESVATMCKTQTESYEDLQKAINDFVIGSPFLTGKAYDSAKAYFQTVLYPLAQGGILLSEAVENAVKKFPEEYLAQVDSGDLKQSELEEQIQQADRLLAQAEDIRTELHSSKTPDVTKLAQLTLNTALIGMYGTTKQKLEEQLQKLLAFHASSPTLFSEIAELQAAVNQGLAQTKTAWNRATGNFTIPNDLSWKQTITEKWADYEVRHADKVEVKKVTFQNGETVYEVYRNGQLDKEATNELAVEIAKDDLKTLQSFLAGAGYQILENNGIKALLDTLFGERNVKESLQQHSGYNQGVFVGNLLGMLQSGAEYIGSALWFVGGAGGSLAVAPVTGGASVDAIPAVGAETLAIWAHATGVGGMSIQNILSGDNYNHKAQAVENMDEFFDTEFGSEIKDNLSKTKKRVDGQNVYKVDKNMPEYGLKKNDQLYLDGLHKDHLEVFDKRGKSKTVLDLDGSKNSVKVKKAEGRILK